LTIWEVYIVKFLKFVLFCGIGLGVLFIGLVAVALLAPSSGSTTRAAAQVATPTPAPDFQTAQALDPRKLTADPKAYRGTNIKLIGKALSVAQHDDYTWVQLMAQTPGANPYTTESLALEIRPHAVSGDVLNQDCYKMYGVVGDPQTVTRTLTGAQNDVPTVNVYRFESVAKNQYGECSAQW
jgi:hypothetical protein